MLNICTAFVADFIYSYTVIFYFIFCKKVYTRRSKFLCTDMRSRYDKILKPNTYFHLSKKKMYLFSKGLIDF